MLVAGTPLTPKCHLTYAFADDSKGWGVDRDNTNNIVQAPGIGNPAIGRANPTPVQMWQAWADAKYGPGVIAFLDWSIPGATIPSTLNGTAPNLTPLATQLAMSPIHIDGVITNLLTNDEYVLGEPVSTYTANINQLIDTVVSYGAIPIFTEPSPTCQANANLFAANGTNALAYAADLTFSNRGYPALGNLNAWENYTSPPNGSPWNDEWMSSDCVHENDPGYAEDVSNYANGSLNSMGNTESMANVINHMLQGIDP
ncbi:MAG: hypothetical protein OSB38_15120 [Paraburkholderia fungorum]|nr:hypothetical protein [Paraburkholderia fungorum]